MLKDIQRYISNKATKFSFLDPSIAQIKSFLFVIKFKSAGHPFFAASEIDFCFVLSPVVELSQKIIF